ncbi:MAG TPA: nodulation protein NfeD [Candidatus Polarisedimenticolia bacterium]|jgi:membrane-bound serine protease (ClpP class)|nr:nodulation protein NfeD [Candidatus Polarisedimenticolia bacterium]
MRRITRRPAGSLLRVLAVVAIAACAASARGVAPAPSPTAGEALVLTVTIDDAIHPITARFLKEAIARANREDAALLIVKLDTPGGWLNSTEEMIRDITSSRVPVVVFVNGSKAASAGFFITIAADVAVMAPGTRIGAAHPVAAMGEIPKDSPMMAKIENDAAAYARSLASNRGRNEKVAEEIVRKSSAFTEREALKLRLIDYVCRDEGEILAVLDGKTIRRFDGRTETLRLGRVRVVSLDMSTRERLLSVLANPTVALFLLFAGVVGLYIEFTHPGMIAPGVVGGVCLLLFALSSQILPMSWVGVALVVLAIAMFLLELKVPSYGTLTIGGIVCLVLGAMLLFKGAPSAPGIGVARWAILSIAGTAGVIMAILTTLVVRVSRRRPTTGSVGLVGERGTALTDLDPGGRVFVHGEYWNARAARPIPKGTAVRVTRVQDLAIEVEEIS